MLTKKDAIAADFHRTYLTYLGDEPVMKALKKNSRQFKKLLSEIPGKKVDFAYAPGKWTIKEMLQHIIDAERVFSYRALRFARKDATPIPGFDEKEWAAHAEASRRKWEDLVDEFKAVRKATERLFASFGPDQWLSVGTASNQSSNTLALGYLCSGHVIHHMRIIRERYL
jgi:hypothetical protein